MEQNEKKAVPHLKAWGDWLVMFQDLDDAQFGRLMRAAISYVCAGVEPDMSEWAKEDRLPFNILRPVLDKNRGNYLEKVRKNTENGAKGAAARWGTEGERHTENGERYLTNGENSQEKERRHCKTQKSSANNLQRIFLLKIKLLDDFLKSICRSMKLLVFFFAYRHWYSCLNAVRSDNCVNRKANIIYTILTMHHG